ncbi:DUF7261 family protein [Halorussus lipolyticus]|uniref:DUF7261 family protein n=1 Tax=Halorussus lipolyticus TaxID=3034024 RepID=UPI0023E802FD|nr:hypothetical protein [Halorussus sp. DT80]
MATIDGLAERVRRWTNENHSKAMNKNAQTKRGRARDARTDADRNQRATADRGQLVLVGALALAVSLVVLAVVLNSAIYTQNLASRSSEAGTGAAVDVRESVRDGVGGVADSVNRNRAGADYAVLSGTHLPTALADWRPMAVRQQVVSGRTVSVATAGTTEGTRIADESAGEFRPQSAGATPLGYAEPHWMVAADAEVRNFRLSGVSSADLVSATASFDPKAKGTFFVEVREADGSQKWQVGVYDAGGSVGVMVWDEETETSIGSCQATGGSAVVDLTDATIGGQHCEALSFFAEADGPLNVYYVNGDDVIGTYELTVDRAGHATGDTLKNRVDSANYGRHCAGPTYADSPGSGPYAAAAVYSTAVDFRFVSESVTYETDLRSAPGEPGPAPEHPRITDFSVTDDSGTDASFDVSWAVTDPNADLDSVTVELKQSGTTVAGPTTVGVGGATDSGTVTVSDSNGGSETYTVVVTVTDDAGHARTDAETHAADGTTGTGCPQ